MNNDRIVKTMSTKYPGQFIYVLYINNQIEGHSNSLTNVRLLAELAGLNSSILFVYVEVLEDKQIEDWNGEPTTIDNL